jgi:UDP-N-acetylglucosamine 2-epimerase (hydrolysing)
MQRKKIVFITSTRADFGKMKLLIRQVEASDRFEACIFATGMHMLPQYGVTAHEILKCDFENIYFFNNQAFHLGMDISLANTIMGLSCYVRDLSPDLIVVHGDRPETLAGAIVGSFNNTRVAHIEGGELSGTIDGLIRHATTKLAHVHFATNEDSARRLIQMGESRNSVFVIGSPEIDLMLSDQLPSLEQAKTRYEIHFDDYAIFIYHPVTTEKDQIPENVKHVIDAVIESGLNYIVINPNNDAGSDVIAQEYRRFDNLPRMRVFPSIRFEYFMTFFKYSRFILGNSSAGVREAPVFGVPTINVGTRQTGRNHQDSIFDVREDKCEILSPIKYIVDNNLKFEPFSRFGDGRSVERFMQTLNSDAIWLLPLQKEFEDYCLRRLKSAAAHEHLATAPVHI